MKDRITKEKIERYFRITSEALEKARKSMVNEKEEDAKEIIEMVENYLSDAEYFEKKGDLVNAFGAINYAHGWLDSGVRLDVFKAKDNRLFTIK